MAVVAILLVVALCATVTTASAETRVYAQEKVIITDYSQPPWNWYHFGLVYGVSLQANENAHIGGIDQATLSQYAPEHSNTRDWDRQSYGSGKSVLLIPKRYVLHRWNYGSEIYLAFSSSHRCWTLNGENRMFSPYFFTLNDAIMLLRDFKPNLWKTSCLKNL